MADKVKTHEGSVTETAEAVHSVPASTVVAQESKQVGDDVAGPREPTAVVHSGTVPAQVSPPREADSATVPVHEVSVQLDEVITDPSDPRAVQVPDAGRGDSSLPIHRLAAPSPEAVFAESGSKAVKVSDEDREKARSEGRSVGQAKK